MIRKKIAAKGINALLALSLLVLSYLLFPHQNELKDYIAATIIAFSIIAFLPIPTIGNTIGYAVLKLKPKQNKQLFVKYLIIYICFCVPTQFIQIFIDDSISLAIVISCVATIGSLSIESLLLIITTRGRYDCLDYLLGIEYNGSEHIGNSWLKGTLLLLLCFVFIICFSFSAEVNNSWQNTAARIRNDNQTYGQDIYFEWDQLYGLCNSIFVMEEKTQDICLPTDIESLIRKKDCSVWTVYASCNKRSINNLERRKAIVQEIAWSLRLNQIDTDRIPECYRIRLYYSDYSTPFSTERISYEYFLNRDISRLSGGVDMNAVLQFNKLIHDNYSQLVVEVLSITQRDSLLRRYKSGESINLTPDIEDAIVHQSIKHIDSNTDSFAIPIVSFEDVKPIHGFSIGFSFPINMVDINTITSTPEKSELDTFREKEMPFSFYYLSERLILSSIKPSL